MSKRKFDLVVKTGSYRDASGADKTRFQRVGCVMASNDEGRPDYIILERWFNPAGIGEPGKPVFISMYPPGERDQKPEGGDSGPGDYDGYPEAG